ncbi:hypothetical protein HanIR_Chr16g0820701 [Helianthus annuus]|nr:hypothetical protein HanIR_Chr16g0820701 [Helianthus annuus]
MCVFIGVCEWVRPGVGGEQRTKKTEQDRQQSLGVEGLGRRREDGHEDEPHTVWS